MQVTVEDDKILLIEPGQNVVLPKNAKRNGPAWVLKPPTTSASHQGAGELPYFRNTSAELSLVSLNKNWSFISVRVLRAPVRFPKCF